MIRPDLSTEVIGYAIRIHKRVGPGMLESVYETLLEYELTRAGHKVDRQCPIPVVYEEVKMPDGFRADLVVDDKLLVEIKSVDALAPVHFKQVVSYLKCANLPVGLLINFNASQLKEGLHRIVNEYAVA